MRQVTTKEKYSAFGQYKGYTDPIYDGWSRTSQYITVRDGTKLAADFYFPTKNGVKELKALPVIWIHTRYIRAIVDPEKGLHTMLYFDPWIKTVLKYGYIIAVIDARGTGGSFGYRYGEFPISEANDAYDVTEWLASMPWSTGKIGMFGRSYGGITQLMAASKKPPSLKAIFPEMSMFDAYDFIYHGGVFRSEFMKKWAEKVNLLDKLDDLYVIPPVDEDNNMELLKSATSEHKKNIDPYTLWETMKYRNSRDNKYDELMYLTRSPSSYIQAIQKSNIPVYILSGWFDIFTRDSFLLYSNLEKNKKMMIGPWSHMELDNDILAIEHVRWFDYWLKGIDNGIMSEDQINYYTLGNSKEENWNSTSVWPLPSCKLVDYYLEEPIDNNNLINGGSLSEVKPISSSNFDEYIIDYSTTTGTSTRWSNGYGGEYGYQDMTKNDLKCLNYTTKPFSKDTEITGHPIAKIYACSTLKEVSVFVYLTVVDENGCSTYITEGVLKSTHVALSQPPYNNIELPYHKGYKEEATDLKSNVPTEFYFDLQPISIVIKSGQRLRVVISCNDKDNAPCIESNEQETFCLFRNLKYPSKILLPIVENQE